MIDYSPLCARLVGMPTAIALDTAKREHEALWLGDYRRVVAVGNVHEIRLGSFVFLFDIASEIDSPAPGGVQIDRVVAAYGRSSPPLRPRDASRMKGYLGITSKVLGHGYDKGHYFAQSMGGDTLDSVNWFPRERRLNRGWSQEGRQYREFETYCAHNPGTFLFSRPEYADFSDRPAAIEVSAFRDGELQIRHFDNRV